jgi:hypothetical protein
VFVEPGLDLDRVEAEEPADLDVRDAPLEDHPPDVADGDAEPLGDGMEVEELLG